MDPILHAINGNEDILNDLYTNTMHNDPAMNSNDEMSTNIKEIDYHPNNKSMRNDDFNNEFEFYRLLKQVLRNNRKYNKKTCIYKYIQLLSENNLLIDQLKKKPNNKSVEINEFINIHNDTLDLINKKINKYENKKIKKNKKDKTLFSYISYEKLLSPDVIMLFIIIVFYIIIYYKK
jgi:hypothetical protein